MNDKMPGFMNHLELAEEIVRIELELELEFDPRKKRLAELVEAFGGNYASMRRVTVWIGSGQVRQVTDATDEQIAHQLANPIVWKTRTLEENLAVFDRNRAMDRRAASGFDPRGGPMQYDDIERHQMTGGDPEYTARMNQVEQIEAVFLRAELERRLRARR